MAHYAKLDENNIVLDVICICDTDCLDDAENECEENGRRMCEALTGHAKWKKTSYNTRLGVHYKPNILPLEPSEDQTKAFRLNFARIGMKYDEDIDGFTASLQLYSNMPIDATTGLYYVPEPNVPAPTDGQYDVYPLDTYKRTWYWDPVENEWIKFKLVLESDEERRKFGYCFHHTSMPQD